MYRIFNPEAYFGGINFVYAKINLIPNIVNIL